MEIHQLDCDCVKCTAQIMLSGGKFLSFRAVVEENVPLWMDGTKKKGPRPATEKQLNKARVLAVKAIQKKRGKP